MEDTRYQRLNMQVLAFSTPDVITTSDTEDLGDSNTDNSVPLDEP